MYGCLYVGTYPYTHECRYVPMYIYKQVCRYTSPPPKLQPSDTKRDLLVKKVPEANKVHFWSFITLLYGRAPNDGNLCEVQNRFWMAW
jgi:hypothetical protein